MRSFDDLRQTLDRIDGRGYKAYKDIRGAYAHGNLELYVDHVQGDPFAAPSKVRVRIPLSVAHLPDDLQANPVRCRATEDFIARQFAQAIRRGAEGRRGSGKSGLISIDAGAQEVLERTAVVLNPEWVEARLECGLPARGRRVLGRQAAEMLCDELPGLAAQALVWRNLPQRLARPFVDCVENQEAVRAQLDARGLVAFVAEGAVLPRESGASDRPLRGDAVVKFQPPEALAVTVEVPNAVDGAKTLRGMGVPKGVTLIVGGGYHGKSTLLRALERGVYPHVPGDGREYVVSTPGAVKIRAEDGRRVEAVDIAPFISNLPQGRDTRAFSTDDASGSTSQAANILEALEAGATALLLDEDTSATNFMVRDARMQALVHKEHEPITPFLDRVRELYDAHGVSTVLVVGGVGDYFDVADTVIMMRDFAPHEVTADAKRIAEEHAADRAVERVSPMAPPVPRVPLAESFDPSRGKRDVKIDAKERDLILYGREPIDLRGVEQLVDRSQTRAVGHAIHLACEEFMDGARTLAEVLDAVDAFLDDEGLDPLDPFHRAGQHPGNYARPRRFEIAAAINRLRTVRMQQRRN